MRWLLRWGMPTFRFQHNNKTRRRKTVRMTQANEQKTRIREGNAFNWISLFDLGGMHSNSFVWFLLIRIYTLNMSVETRSTAAPAHGRAALRPYARNARHASVYGECGCCGWSQFTLSHLGNQRNDNHFHRSDFENDFYRFSHCDRCVANSVILCVFRQKMKWEPKKIQPKPILSQTV